MHDCTAAGALQAQAVDRFHKIIENITRERARQDAKWGEQNHPPQDWLAILMEEVGEFARAHMEVYYVQPLPPNASAEAVASWRAAVDAKRRHVREELVQVAAVAVAMIECCDRQRWSPQ
jgi:NTP pyrophosphatase (non-canonical NTP hydrolase)